MHYLRSIKSEQLKFFGLVKKIKIKNPKKMTCNLYRIFQCFRSQGQFPKNLKKNEKIYRRLQKLATS